MAAASVILAALLITTAAHAAEPSFTGDGWSFDLGGPAKIAVDGGAPADAAGPVYRLPTLPPGLHKLAIAQNGTTEQFIVRTGKGAETAPSKPHMIDVPVPAPGAPATAETVRISQDDAIGLHVTSAQPVEIHLHGYDIKAEASVTLLLKADLAGRFSLETHGKPEHTLLYLEVYPK